MVDPPRAAFCVEWNIHPIVIHPLPASLLKTFTLLRNIAILNGSNSLISMEQSRVEWELTYFYGHVQMANCECQYQVGYIVRQAEMASLAAPFYWISHLLGEAPGHGHGELVG